jgi:hypothetical protein
MRSTAAVIAPGLIQKPGRGGGGFFSRTSLFFLIVLFLMTLKTHRSYMGQGDEPHYIVIAESVWLDQDFDLTNNYVSPWLREFDPEDYHAARRPDGRLIATHSIGMSIIGAPVYGLVHFLLTETPLSRRVLSRDQRWVWFKNAFSLAMMFLAGTLGVVLYRLFQEVVGDDKAAWLSALMLMFAPPLLSYGFLFFTELPSGLAIAVLVLRLVRKEPFGLLDALCLGVLPYLHPRNYAVAGMLLLFRLPDGSHPWWRPRCLVSPWSVAAACLTAALWVSLLLVNYSFWGTYNPAAPYAAIGQKAFDPACLFTTLPGYFLDRSFGLIVFAPAYALAPAGFLLLWRRDRFLTLILVALAGVYVVGVSGFRWGWGGWSPGPRYIVPVVPLIAVGSAALFAAGLKKGGIARLASWAIFVMNLSLSALFWVKPKLLWNQPDGKSQFLLYWFGTVGENVHGWLPNFFDPFPGPHVQAALMIAVIFVINGLFLRCLRTETPIPSTDRPDC